MNTLEGTLLSGIDAEARAVSVNSCCSMGPEAYLQHHHRPGLCNIQLKASRATSEDLAQWPARLALADAIRHVKWVAENYDALEREFPNHPWNEIMTVETGLDVPQELLHRIVSSLYTKTILVDANIVETLMFVAEILQVPAVMDAASEYIKKDIVPKHPAACHQLGLYRYPQLNLEEAVLEYFKTLQWDGAISQTMLHSIGIVLERCDNETALHLVRSLTEAPALISPLQAASMTAHLPAPKREALLAGLNIDNLSMADVQSLLHWANNRRTNRSVLADSPILWDLLYSNIASSLLPLDCLKEKLGHKAAQMKLWDLPLAHIPPNPGRYKTRRSGWLHLGSGRSFCMEAVYTKSEPGAEWGLFCNPDRRHALMPHYTVRLCAIQQGVQDPLIQVSPDIKPDAGKKLGLGMGFDELLSKWAADPHLVWLKNSQKYLTLGLYVDLNDEDLLAQPTSERNGGIDTQTDGDTFVLPNPTATSNALDELERNFKDGARGEYPKLERTSRPRTAKVVNGSTYQLTQA